MLICRCVTTVKKKMHTAATTVLQNVALTFFLYDIVYHSNELDYTLQWTMIWTWVTMACPNMAQRCIGFIDWIVAYTHTHRLCLSQWPHESPFKMVQRFDGTSTVGPLLEIFWSVLIVKHEVCKNRSLNLKITD